MEVLYDPTSRRPFYGGFMVTLLVVRGLLPAFFAITMGNLVGAVQANADLVVPLGLVGIVFTLLQVLTPIHLAVSTNLGSKTARLAVRRDYHRLYQSCGDGPPRKSETHKRSDNVSRF